MMHPRDKPFKIALYAIAGIVAGIIALALINAYMGIIDTLFIG